MIATEWKYGYTQIKRIPASAEPALLAAKNEPHCRKCRHLTSADGPCCTRGHALDAKSCGAFSDASKPREFFPPYFHEAMRR